MSQAILAFDLDFFKFHPPELDFIFYSTFFVAMRVQREVIGKPNHYKYTTLWCKS